MKHWTPLVTALVVMLGLIGVMTANAVGSDTTGQDAAQETPDEPTTTEPEPTTEPPTTTTEAPTTEPPEAPQFPEEVVYAGPADDSDLVVAVAIKGNDAVAYLCDGAAVESWLVGSAEDGQVELASNDGTATLTAQLDGDDLTGTASAGGTEVTFTIAVADAPAGLYRGEDGETTIGWIVLPDGSQVGIESTGDSTQPAPELDPDDRSVEGRDMTADKVEGDTTF